MRYLIFAFAIFLFAACANDSGSKSDKSNKDSLPTAESEHLKKIKKIFVNLPSPVEMNSILLKAGAKYHGEWLNGVENQSKYTTNVSIALNLGVYGADLSYNRIFEQIQQTISYLSAIKKLATKLGIPQDEKYFAINRVEANLDNRDSLLQIIMDIYSATDEYLKDNDRGSTAAFVLVGGWIETLYIALNTVDLKNPNPDLLRRIAEQKFSLDNLAELLDLYKREPDIIDFIIQIQKLKNHFDKLEVEQIQNSSTTDVNKKETSIDNGNNIKVDLEIMKTLKIEVSQIRRAIVK